VLTEENLDEIGARLEHTPLKSCTRDQHLEITAAKAMKLLELRPYKATVVMICYHVTQLTGLISATGFCNQLMTVKLNPIELFSSDEAWFNLHGHVSSQIIHNGFLSTKLLFVT
jgi:hypothetical protein